MSSVRVGPQVAGFESSQRTLPLLSLSMFQGFYRATGQKYKAHQTHLLYIYKYPPNPPDGGGARERILDQSPGPEVVFRRPETVGEMCF